MAKVITLAGLVGRMGAVNPASENCIAQGGDSQVVNESTGARGICIFPDGSVCDEWALYRKECTPGLADTPLCVGEMAGLDPVIIDGRTYCQSPDTGKIYDRETGLEYKAEVSGSKLLNYGIAAGVGALTGLIIAASKSKKGSVRLAGAGVGAALASIVLVMTWPKMGKIAGMGRIMGAIQDCSKGYYWSTRKESCVPVIKE